MFNCVPFSRRILPLLLIFVLSFTGCEDEEFMFNIDDLLNTRWGIPQVIESGMEPIDLDAPTIFTADGTVTIGNSRFEYWEVRGSRSIRLEQMGEIWFIIDLKPERLYVEKTKHPEGTFIAKCLYEPLKK